MHLWRRQCGLVLMLGLLLGMLASCSSLPKLPCVTCSPKPSKPSKPVKPVETKPITMPEFGGLKLSIWSEIDSLWQDDLIASWPAWLQSCQGLKNKVDWAQLCQVASTVNKTDSNSIRNYWTQYFDVYSTSKQNGEQTGLITGYYQPILKGARTPSSKYPYPLYKQPNDLITVNLTNLFPELKYKRVRGRLNGNTLVPYYTRADIERDNKPLQGNELAWVENNIEAFFLEVQGSGVVQFENGESIQVGYADQNGHPYQSIGKVLIDRGELTSSQASMQGIKEWAKKNPQKLRDLLNANPSYVFFRELPMGLSGPLGALGVPLTAERSIAVDPKYIPLGAPVYLSTTYPNSSQSLQRLMMAQDTGGAIKDGVRADFYWGTGDYAGKMAGSMKQSGKMWVLLPKGFKLPN